MRERMNGAGRKTLLAGLLLLTGCAASVSGPPLPPTASNQYMLDSGDEVRVTAFGLEGFSNTYLVSDHGAVSLPYLGDIRASGTTVDGLQRAIGEALMKRQIVRNPVINVQISQYRPFYVLGEVKKPGEYPFRPGMSVLTAISVAGGYTFRAKTKTVSITRKLGDRSTTGSARESTPIQPGDTIHVLESWF